MSELFFEYYDVPSVQYYPQPLLSTLSSGYTTGCSVEIGHNLTQVCMVVEGCMLSSYKLLFGGAEGTNILRNLLLNRLYHKIDETQFTPHLEKMKQFFGYVRTGNSTNSLISPTQLGEEGDRFYELPDGRIITINQEREMITEYLFSENKLVDEIFNIIKKTDKGITQKILNSFVLSGGSSMYQGLPQRVDCELKKLLPASTPLKIRATDKRNLMVWKGLSIAEKIYNKRITKADYLEKGIERLFEVEE